jgi:leucine dehydrogenase
MDVSAHSQSPTPPGGGVPGAGLDLVVASDCEQFLLVRDRDAEVTALLAIHDTRLGPAHGGIRRWRYDSLAAATADVVALASAMTWKCALAEVPAGGGKCVVLDRPGLEQPGARRAAAYRLVGRAVAQLGGRYCTGPDVGTTDDDLRVVATETPYVAVGDAGAGPGDLAAATAIGVASALAALAARLRRPLAGLHVVVQGLGAVGLALCERLAARGVRLSVADVMPARVAAAVARCGAQAIAPEAVLRTPADVFAPCALGGVLTAATARELPVRGVCGAANNIFADPVAVLELHRRGILVVPDFVANAGALVRGALWQLQRQAVPDARLERIGTTAGELLDAALVRGLPTTELALQRARERVGRAR